MKKRKNEVKFICNKCGKEQELNKEKSSLKWKVYDCEPCKCGGEFVPNILD